MAIETRRQPYIWTTWITGLLSGDKHCEWSAWFRAHYQGYDKRPETPDRENALSQWKAEHAELVARHAARLRDDGWSVRVEDQNKFNYRGQAATVGGCPDVVATRDGVVTFDDAKSGKARDADFWQVGVYATLYPLVVKDLAELVIRGSVVYQDRDRPIEPRQIVEAKPLIVERIKRTAGAAEPRRTPSPSECAMCDIVGCPDRIDAGVAEADGDLF